MLQRIFICVVVLGGWLAGDTLRGELLALDLSHSHFEVNRHSMVGASSASTSVVPPRGFYERGNRRDPFVPLREPGMKPSNEALYPRTTQIQGHFPTVLGIVFGQNGYGAVLQRSNGERVLVRQGSNLQKEQARVVGISGNAVFLEYRLNEKGQTQVLKRRISLPHSDTMEGSPQG